MEFYRPLLLLALTPYPTLIGSTLIRRVYLGWAAKFLRILSHSLVNLTSANLQLLGDSPPILGQRVLVALSLVLCLCARVFVCGVCASFFSRVFCLLSQLAKATHVMASWKMHYEIACVLIHIERERES